MFDLTPFARGSRGISAYNPFNEMEELENYLFGRQLPAFKTDIRETEQAYILEAELPGFQKEDIHAEIKNDTLIIRAEHQSEEETNKDQKNYIRRERSYGSITRNFSLDGIQRDAITASYRNGVLSLTLPKSETKREEVKQLEIQ